MEDYFTVLDSIPVRDTLDDNFMLLKAYYNNDTIFLRERYREMQINLEQQSEIEAASCGDFVPLHPQGYDEAYRFLYSASFCDTLADITVGNKEHDFEVTSRLYKVDPASGACSLLVERSKKITREVGKAFLDDLNYCDYWGMREKNDVHGLDGASLYVYGYKKDMFTNTYEVKGIYRWMGRRTAIGDLFKKTLAFSAVNVWCFWID